MGCVFSVGGLCGVGAPAPEVLDLVWARASLRHSAQGRLPLVRVVWRGHSCPRAALTLQEGVLTRQRDSHALEGGRPRPAQRGTTGHPGLPPFAEAGIRV